MSHAPRRPAAAAAAGQAAEQAAQEARLLLLHPRRRLGQVRRVLHAVVDAVAVGVREAHPLLARGLHELLAELHPLLGRHVREDVLRRLLKDLRRKLRRHLPVTGLRLLRREAGRALLLEAVEKLLLVLRQVAHLATRIVSGIHKRTPMEKY
ncbi:hypothetical protein GBA65_04010 [Rubrobacter marinus]|uniref:Uncharacterized protein n=1 Tax=Rubrobacter marinus TaxID=2653852 RepID=A0A6G8PTJ6_9ACTN|nr:hypothetical protein GBA65_04010 [Rubrobacter marinus]